MSLMMQKARNALKANPINPEIIAPKFLFYFSVLYKIFAKLNLLHFLKCDVP